MNDFKDITLPPSSQFLVYRTEDGRTKVEVRLEGELQATATIKEFLTVRQELAATFSQTGAK